MRHVHTHLSLSLALLAVIWLPPAPRRADSPTTASCCKGSTGSHRHGHADIPSFGTRKW